MGPDRCENFKKLLLLQIAAKTFQTCPESPPPPNGPRQTMMKIFEILSLSFLALFDYVSRAHEIEIRPASGVRRPSVCGSDYLWSYCMDFF